MTAPIGAFRPTCSPRLAVNSRRRFGSPAKKVPCKLLAWENLLDLASLLLLFLIRRNNSQPQLLFLIRRNARRDFLEAQLSKRAKLSKGREGEGQAGPFCNSHCSKVLQGRLPFTLTLTLTLTLTVFRRRRKNGVARRRRLLLERAQPEFGA